MSTQISPEHVNLTTQPDGLLGWVPFVPFLLARFVLGQRVAPARQPVLETPAEHGMSFESVEFSSIDGVRLSGWWIPSANASRLILVNHPLLCNRYGSEQGMDGVPVAFLPMIRHLHDAGFSVLTYDQRGQGESDGGLGKTTRGAEAPVGAGSVEWQDFVGALRFVGGRPDLAEMDLGFVTHCMGANAALTAWKEAPEAFDLDRVRCHVAVQPTLSYNMMARLTHQKLGINLASQIEQAQRSRYGFGFANALEGVGAVRVPMLFTQVRHDAYTLDLGTGVNDVQVIYDRCPTQKRLVWVGPDEAQPFGSGKRFDGYNYFNEHPGVLLSFLAEHMPG